METRNIELTLEKAQEWYEKGGDLKEIALQVYTKEELTVTEWKNIRTFEDACKALDISSENNYIEVPYNAGNEIVDNIYAVYKLDIIRKVLNKGWNPKILDGTIYYPYVRIYPADKAKEAARSNNWYVKETFKADGNKYSLIGGSCSHCSGGLSGGSYGYGGVLSYLGLFGCKSREIAEHMSRYFAKEIFEACYAHHTGAYEWV